MKSMMAFLRRFAPTTASIFDLALDIALPSYFLNKIKQVVAAADLLPSHLFLGKEPELIELTETFNGFDLSRSSKPGELYMGIEPCRSKLIIQPTTKKRRA